MLFKKSFVIVALIALAIANSSAVPVLAQTATGRFCAQAQWAGGGAAASVPFVVKDANSVVAGSFLTDASGIGCLDVNPGTYTAALSINTWGYSNPTAQTAPVVAGQTVTVPFTVFKRMSDTGAPGNLCVMVKDDRQRPLANINITVKNSLNVVEASFQSNAVSPQCVTLGQGNYTVLADSNPYRIIRPPNPQSAGVLGGLTTDVLFIVALRLSAPATVLVTEDFPQGWGIATTGTALGKFVDGPGGQPNGLKPGSVQYETKANPGGKPQLGTLQFNGKPFDSITTLKYSTFIADYADNNATHLTHVLNVGIDLDGIAGGGDTATMVYEPCYNVSNCTVPVQVKNTWNTWDAWALGQKWWSTRTIPNTDFTAPDPGTGAGSYSYVPLDSLLARYPNAMITFFSINAGQGSGGAPWNNFRGNVDGLVIAFDNGPETTYDFDANTPPIVQTPAPDVSGVEGTLITTSGKFSDPNGDPLGGWTISPNIGTLSVKLQDGTWTWVYTPTDDGAGTVTITASDSKATVSDSFDYSVANVAPTITLFSAGPVPTAINTKVTAKATYTDPGKDTSSWIIIWDDGAMTSASSTDTDGSVNVGGPSAEHVYSLPGVYQLVLQVTDKDGGAASQTFDYVIVYDPNQPDVHGNGEYISLPGAYRDNLGFTDKAKIGLHHPDYPKKGVTPKGKFDFKLEHTDLDFKSTALNWSVLSATPSGPLFTLQGVGKIKSKDGYSFLFSSLVSTLAGQDKVRVKIWETNTGRVIYDNRFGAPDDALPTQLMPKGDIKIKQ